MTAKLKLLYIMHSLAGGGAERGGLTVLQSLDTNIFDINLGVINKEGPLINDIPLGVRVIYVSPEKLINRLTAIRFPGRGMIESAIAVRKMINTVKPDVIVTVLPVVSLPMYVATFFTKKREYTWVVREENNTSATVGNISSSYFLRKILRWMFQRAYSSADYIATTSQGVKQGIISYLKLQPEKIQVMYLPIDVQNLRTRASEEIDWTWDESAILIAAGRITEQKAYDVMLRAFAVVADKLSVRLVILGQGPLEEKLKLLATDLNIAGKVSFLGFVGNPWSYMSRSSAFVLSSRWEGFARVIIEAMACGTPVVATDCDYGPGEIITDGENGLLVPVDDVEELAAALMRVLSNEDMSIDLSERALQRSFDFDISRIGKDFEDLLISTAPATRRPPGL